MNSEASIATRADAQEVKGTRWNLNRKQVWVGKVGFRTELAAGILTVEK